MKSTTALRVEALRKTYGDQTVLDGIDLEVAEGESLVILGGSGSGKSTLLRCLVGLERPDSGRVVLFGEDLSALTPPRLARLRRRIGMAFQSGALFGSMTVADNVDLPLAEFTALPASTRQLIVRIKLALVGLQGTQKLLPAELSGGMRKRAAFARAMALDPDLLFCDEPSAGLDPVTSAGLDRLLIQLREVLGITLVVVTHELDSAFAIADRIALVHAGKVLIAGTPRQVRECDNPVVRAFLDRQPQESAGDEDRFRRLMLGEEAELA